jgi:hypothetical protein
MIGFFLPLVLALAAEPEPPESVALALDVQGDVSLVSGKAPARKLRMMDPLVPGDRLRSAAGAEATLLVLADGHGERLSGGTAVTVGVNGCTPATAVVRQEPQLTERNLSALRDLARTSRSGLGVVRGDSPTKAEVVTPIFGATVLEDRPSLAWPKVPGAVCYEVTLLGGAQGDEEHPLWAEKTDAPRLPFPEKKKSLTRGDLYRWKVVAQLADNSAKPAGQGQFLVAPERTAKALARVQPLTRSKLPADWLLAAAVYEAWNVYGEALPLYERLAERNPNDGNLQRALARYYARAGRTDLADAARAKATRLGVEVQP